MLFDRTNDSVTPLIHDLYYESMLYDLLDIDPSDATYQFEVKLNQKNKQINVKEMNENIE